MGKANSHNGCIGLVACSGGIHTAGCDAAAEPGWIFSEGAEVTYITLKFDQDIVFSVFACTFWQESQCTENQSWQHKFFLLKEVRISVNWNNVTLALSADSHNVLCVFTLDLSSNAKPGVQPDFFLIANLLSPQKKAFKCKPVVSQHSGEQENQCERFIVELKKIIDT